MTDTLKSICERCVQLQEPRLEFIAAEPQRQIVRRDLRELVSASSREGEKAATILAGVVFESILYSFVQGRSDFIRARRGHFEFDSKGSLAHYVAVFNRWLSDTFSTPHRIPDLVVDYRNFVHIDRELQEPPGACALAALEMLTHLNALLERLAEYAPERPPGGAGGRLDEPTSRG